MPLIVVICVYFIYLSVFFTANAIRHYTRPLLLWALASAFCAILCCAFAPSCIPFMGALGTGAFALMSVHLLVLFIDFIES